MFVVRKHSFAPFCALFIFSLVGCGGRDLTSLPTPSSQNVEVTSAYPSVVKVIAPNGAGLCTGTFVSERAVLTAAHCTLTAGTYTIIANFGVFYTTNRANFGPGVVNDPNDLSILWFNVPVADASAGQVSRIGEGAFTDDVVRLVGFGCNNIQTRTGSGLKRTGTNVVYDVNEYIELITPLNKVDGAHAVLGPVNRAGSCFGDSGGPMYKDDSGELKVVGIAHAGGYDSRYSYSDYVSLHRSDNRNFIRQVSDAKGLDIEI